MPNALVGGIQEFSGINYANEGEELGDVGKSRILNLFNLGKISNEDLASKVEDTLGIELDSPEGLDYINSLYQKTLHFYKEILLIDLKDPFLSWKCKTKSEVCDFLRYTSTSKHRERRQIYCDFVKIMFCYDEIEKNPQMKHAEENTRRFVADAYLTKGYSPLGDFEFDMASIMEKKEGEDYYETKGVYLKNTSKGIKKIKCTLRYRGKSPEKMVVKMLGNDTGSSKILDIIKDSIGVELEPENNEDDVYILEYQYFTHCKNGTIEQTEFRQKPGFYSNEQIEKFLENEDLSEEFRLHLEGLTTLKKPTGTIKYQDCKHQGMMDVGDGMMNGCESRIVRNGNKNQSGLSASEIVDGRKAIEAIIGLRGWVSKSYVRRVVGSIQKRPDVLKSEEAIEDFFIDPLVKVQVPKLGRNIYSSKKRLVEVIENASEYPDFIVNAVKKAISTDTARLMSPKEIVREVQEKGVKVFD